MKKESHGILSDQDEMPGKGTTDPSHHSLENTETEIKNLGEAEEENIESQRSSIKKMNTGRQEFADLGQESGRNKDIISQNSRVVQPKEDTSTNFFTRDSFGPMTQPKQEIEIEASELDKDDDEMNKQYEHRPPSPYRSSQRVIKRDKKGSSLTRSVEVKKATSDKEESQSDTKKDTATHLVDVVNQKDKNRIYGVFPSESSIEMAQSMADEREVKNKIPLQLDDSHILSQAGVSEGVPRVM